MIDNISELQNDIEKAVKEKASGLIVDFGNNFKLYCLKSVVQFK